MPAPFRLTKKMHAQIQSMINTEKYVAEPKQISDDRAFKNLVERWGRSIS